MNNQAKLSIAFLIGLAYFVTGCGKSSTTATEEIPSSNSEATSKNEDTEGLEEIDYLSLEPNPASIIITLDEGTSATATIGAEGGVLEMVDANGTQYKLTIPAGALFSPEQITMTQIASAEGEVIGDTFLAGASLQPEGLHFLELVTLEIKGSVIEEGAVAFATQDGGQDLHLTISSQEEDTLIITATHFTDWGAASERFLEAVRVVVPMALDARAEWHLARGTPENAVRVLRDLYTVLLQAGENIETYEEWEIWTAAMLSLIQRTQEESTRMSWSEDIPGFSDLIEVMQNLIDEWVRVSGQVIETLSEGCENGEIANLFRIELIGQIYSWLQGQFTLEPGEDIERWMALSHVCLNLGLTWQGNVVATGANFFSDISLSAEVIPLIWGTPLYVQTPLQVDFINGFFSDCSGRSGETELGLTIDSYIPNIRPGSVTTIKSITVNVLMVTPAYIDCTVMTAGVAISPDAQFPYHGGALNELNQNRVGEEGGWVFELKYDPGGGLVGQFEEGPLTLPFSGGKYDLWQLVGLYVISPEN